MNGQDIRDLGGIYFENIITGFDSYKHQIVKMDARQAYDYIKVIWAKNGVTSSYIDFYYGQLGQESKAQIEAQLSVEETAYLKEFHKSNQALFVPVNERLLQISLKLNATQMLFSSYYFIQYPCTIWANYNQEYVIFEPNTE